MSDEKTKAEARNAIMITAALVKLAYAIENQKLGGAMTLSDSIEIAVKMKNQVEEKTMLPL